MYTARIANVSFFYFCLDTLCRVATSYLLMRQFHPTLSVDNTLSWLQTDYPEARDSNAFIFMTTGGTQHLGQQGTICLTDGINFINKFAIVNTLASAADTGLALVQLLANIIGIPNDVEGGCSETYSDCTQQAETGTIVNPSSVAASTTHWSCCSKEAMNTIIITQGTSSCIPENSKMMSFQNTINN